MNLALRNLSVDIGEKEILRDVSFHVSTGEMVGLIGPNGAGKSTCMKVIAGIQAYTTGEIILDGNNLMDYPPRRRGQQIAYFAQNSVVEWDLSVENVVRLGRYPHGDQKIGETLQIVDSVLDSVDAIDLKNRTVASLSGGEKARVLLARALAVQAPFLIADEPVSDLDPYHQLQVMAILSDATQRGMGVMAVLHDMTLAARFMDRIVVLDQGRVVADGPPDDVLTSTLLAEVYGVESVSMKVEDKHYSIPWRLMDKTQ